MKQIPSSWKEELLKSTDMEGLQEFYQELKTEGEINPSEYAREHDLHPSSPARYGNKLSRVGLAEKKKGVTGGGKQPPLKKSYYTLSQLGEGIDLLDFEDLTNLTLGWFEILSYLRTEEARDSEECLSPASIARSVEKRWTPTKRSLENLQELGYVNSERVSRNNSPTLYSLTEEGKEVSRDIKLTEAEERDMKKLSEKGELTSHQLADLLGLKSESKFRYRLNSLTEKGEKGLVQRRKCKDSICYRLTAKGERTVNLWFSPKLAEVIRAGNESEEEPKQYFQEGWSTGQNMKYSEGLIEDLIDNYVDFEDYETQEQLVRTGELAAIIDRSKANLDYALEIGEVVQEHLPWSLNKIEDKLTQVLEEFSDQEEPLEEGDFDLVELETESF